MESGGRQYGAAVRLVQVRAHTGHVTYVVTYIVRNSSRVAGIVLGYTGLDLTDQIRAYVSGLGIDTSADTCEECLSGRVRRHVRRVPEWTRPYRKSAS